MAFGRSRTGPWQSSHRVPRLVAIPFPAISIDQATPAVSMSDMSYDSRNTFAFAFLANQSPQISMTRLLLDGVDWRSAHRRMHHRSRYPQCLPGRKAGNVAASDTMGMLRTSRAVSSVVERSAVTSFRSIFALPCFPLVNHPKRGF